MSNRMRLVTALASTAALGLLALAGGVAAQSGLSYAIVQAADGTVISNVSGNGTSTGVATVSCPSGARYTASGCPSAQSPSSVVVFPTAGLPTAAQRTAGITCTAPAVPTSNSGTWSCKSAPVCAPHPVRPGVSIMECR